MIMRHASRAVSDLRERRCAKCGKTSKITCNMERDRFFFFLCHFEHERILPHLNHTHVKKPTYIMETPYMHLRAGPTRNVIRRTSCSPQNTREPPPRDRGSQNTCLFIHFAYVYRSQKSRKQSLLAFSKLEQIFAVRKHENRWGRRGPV